MSVTRLSCACHMTCYPSGDYLLYLDPHTTQPVVSAKDPLHVPDDSYHISQPDSMQYHELDPSLALVGGATLDSMHCHEVNPSLALVGGTLHLVPLIIGLLLPRHVRL